MKINKTYRFSELTNNLLKELSKKLDWNETKCVENAIYKFAESVIENEEIKEIMKVSYNNEFKFKNNL